MLLKYQKTISTHSRCTFPKCKTPTDRLRLISRRTRFKAMKTKELFIPTGARACHQHFNDNEMLSWDVDAVNSSHKFNRQQIEDVINLLNESNLNNPNVPGNSKLFY